MRGEIKELFISTEMKNTTTPHSSHLTANSCPWNITAFAAGVASGDAAEAAQVTRPAQEIDFHRVIYDPALKENRWYYFQSCFALVSNG